MEAGAVPSAAGGGWGSAGRGLERLTRSSSPGGSQCTERVLPSAGWKEDAPMAAPWNAGQMGREGTASPP